MTGRPRSALSLGASLALLLCLQASAQHAYGALAPVIRDEFSAGADEMGLIASALYLGTVIAAFGLGGWVDRTSPRRVAMVCAGVIAVSLMMIVVSSGIVFIAAGYLLVGLGRGAIPPLTDKIGFDHAALGRRGIVFGIKQTGTPLGAVLAGVVLAPIATTVLGWRGALLILAGGVLLGSAAVTLTLPPELSRDHTTSGGDAIQRPRVTGALVRRLAIPMGLSFGLGIHQATVATFLTLYLVDATMLDAVGAARWFALLSIGGAAGRVIWGWMSDRVFGGRNALALATSAFLTGLMSLIVGTMPSLLAGASGAVLIAVYGLTSQGWIGVSRAWGAELAGPGFSGRAGGILLGSMMLAGLLGPPVFGWVVESGGGYRVAWTMLSGAAFASGALAMWGTRHTSRPASARDPSINLDHEEA